MSEAHWHILTVTRGGTVSLLRNVTADVARQTMQRLTSMRPFSPGDPWSDRAIAARAEADAAAELRPGREVWATSGGFYRPRANDLERVECFGPEGEVLEVWPKPADYEARYATALEAARAALRTPA